MSRTQIIKTNAVKKQAKSRQLQFRSVFEISLSIKACKQKVFLDIRLFGIASGECVLLFIGHHLSGSMVFENET